MAAGLETVLDPITGQKEKHMAAGIETTIDRFGKSLHGRKVMVNFEVNDTCALTPVCGDDCVLKMRGSIGPSISQEFILEAVREALDNGKGVRHVVFAAKEPLESPGILFSALDRYHGMNTGDRPGSIGFITASPLLRDLAPRFKELPVDVCMVSVDGTETGLHQNAASGRLLGDALKLRECGGTKFVSVNTAFNASNREQALQIGRNTLKAGVDQWTCFAFMKPVGDGSRKMVPTFSFSKLRELASEIAETFPIGKDQTVLVECNRETLEGIDLPKVSKGWRIDCELPGTNVVLIAPSFEPNTFVRLRYDGQLISHDEVAKQGVKNGKFGEYRPGALQKLLREFEAA